MSFLKCCKNKTVITKQGERGVQGSIGPPGPAGLTGATGTVTSLEKVDSSVIDLTPQSYAATLGTLQHASLAAGTYLAIFSAEIKTDWLTNASALQEGAFAFFHNSTIEAGSAMTFRVIETDSVTGTYQHDIFSMQKIISVTGGKTVEVRHQFSVTNAADQFLQKGILTLLKLS